VENGGGSRRADFVVLISRKGSEKWGHPRPNPPFGVGIA
jgi:hypothetical protein